MKRFVSWLLVLIMVLSLVPMAAFAAEDPAADSTLSVADAIALGASKEHNTYTTGKYYVTGVISSVYNTTYGNMYIADADGNILTVYGTYDADGTNRYDAMEVKPVAGDTVTVYGVIGQYNGTAQIKNGWIVSHTAAEKEEEPSEPEVQDPAADTELTVAEAISLGTSKDHNTYTEGKYYVVGTITEVKSTKYGNMYIADEDGNTIYVYGVYSADGNTRYDKMEGQPAAGDVISVYGIIGQYNGTAQIKNGWATVLECAEHAVKHIEAVAPSCEAEGNIEYWYCAKCNTVWQDEEQTQLTNFKNVILPATHNNIKHVEAVAASCEAEGNIEYWYCEDCLTFWQDEAMLQITNSKNVITPATHNNIKHVEAVAATCTTEGNVEYWYCEDCNTVWIDEAMLQISNRKNVITPAACQNIVHVEAVDPGCHYIGNAEHWYCEDCDTVWADENLMQITNHKNVIIPELGGEVKHVEAVAPSCYTEGNIEYWYCEECMQVWQDEARTQLTNIKNVVLPATHSNIEHVAAVAPSCYEEGNIEYWYCADCQTVWQDEAMLQITNFKNVILPATHQNVKHVEAKAAKCEKEGNIEYWYCADCNTVWQDENQMQLTNFKNVITPALEHVAGAWEVETKATCTKKGKLVQKCTLCGDVINSDDEDKEEHVDEDKDKKCDECGKSMNNPDTGDIIMISVVVMVLAAAAIVVLIKKRRAV